MHRINDALLAIAITALYVAGFGMLFTQQLPDHAIAYYVLSCISVAFWAGGTIVVYSMIDTYSMPTIDDMQGQDNAWLA